MKYKKGQCAILPAGSLPKVDFLFLTRMSTDQYYSGMLPWKHPNIHQGSVRKMMCYIINNESIILYGINAFE